MALLNVDQLSVHFGDEGTPFKAVDRISYSVKQGEVVGIVGESGSGKSRQLAGDYGAYRLPRPRDGGKPAL